MTTASSRRLGAVRASRWWSLGVLLAVTVALLMTGPLARLLPAYAVTTAPALGTAAGFSVLGGTGVSNTGTTNLSGDLGVSPGGAISGFPPGVVSGATHPGDAAASQASTDFTAAYNDAAARTPTRAFSGDQNAITFTTGVYQTNAAFALTGTMTLDGLNDPNSVFIFQVNAALNTAAASTIALTNGALASHVYWQITGAVGTGASSTFIGTVLAVGAITIGAGASVSGRLLSNGLVTLSSNAISLPPCTVTPTPSSSPAQGPVAPGGVAVSPAPIPVRSGWWDSGAAGLPVSSGSLSPATGVTATVTGTVAAPTVTLTWTPTTTTYASGYRIQRSTGAAVPNQIATVTSQPASSYLDSTVTGSTTYTYYLTAYVSSWTANSATVSLTTTGTC